MVAKYKMKRFLIQKSRKCHKHCMILIQIYSSVPRLVQDLRVASPVGPQLLDQSLCADPHSAFCVTPVWDSFLADPKKKKPRKKKKGNMSHSCLITVS